MSAAWDDLLVDELRDHLPYLALLLGGAEIHATTYRLATLYCWPTGHSLSGVWAAGDRPRPLYSYS